METGEMRNETVKAAMRGKGLVHRQILTKKGAHVWRWVRPDNPNVVNPEPLKAKTTKAKAQKAQPAPEPAEPVPTRWKVRGYLSCCGGRIVLAEPPGVGKLDEPISDERAVELYNRSQMKRYHEMYTRRLDEYRRAVKRLKAGKCPNKSEYYAGYDPVYYGGAEATLRMLLGGEQTLLNARDSNSLEAFKKLGCREPNYTGYSDVYVDNVPVQRGVTVSTDIFPGATETPAGMFVRCDYVWDNKKAFEEALVETFPAVEQPTITAAKRTPTGINEPMVMTGTNHVCVYVGALNTAEALWCVIGYYGKRRGWLKPGVVVTFIRNRSQMSPAISKSMAAGGFHCSLITGNATHPNYSILYLFERKITEADIEQL